MYVMYQFTEMSLVCWKCKKKTVKLKSGFRVEAEIQYVKISELDMMSSVPT